MPINRKYNIGMLLDALREELALKENFKVLFEYVLLAGINDRSVGLLIKISLGFCQFMAAFCFWLLNVR